MGRLARWMFVIGLGLATVGGRQARGQQVFEEDEPESVTKVAEMLRYVQFRVVGGRIVAECSRQGLNLTTETRDVASGRWERLTLDMSNDAPGLRYERKSSHDDVVIELSDGEHLIVRRTVSEPAASVEFEQSPDGELTLTIAEGGKERQVVAPTLWHLLLVEPQIGQKQLVPLLELLRPSWQLAGKATAIEQSLLRWAETQRHVDRARLARLVQALGDPHYSQRRAAARELAASGEPALMYLAGLRRQDLDAEQWQRVQVLLSALAGDHEDTAERSVAWLAGDLQVWLALAARDDLSIRQAAADELRLLLNGPIDFDPGAVSAERAAQLKHLEARIHQLQAAEVHAARSRRVNPAGPSCFGPLGVSGTARSRRCGGCLGRFRCSSCRHFRATHPIRFHL